MIGFGILYESPRDFGYEFSKGDFVYFNRWVDEDGTIKVQWSLYHGHSLLHNHKLWQGIHHADRSAAGTFSVAAMIGAAIKAGALECEVVM